MTQSACAVKLNKRSSHPNRFYATDLEAKTSGRVIDLIAIRREISHLELILKESEKLFGFFRQTAHYLYERELAARKRMEWLKIQQKAQKELRIAFEAFSRGPTLPREIINTVLGHVPAINRLPGRWGLLGIPDVYIIGLLLPAVYNPSLLLPHYKECFNSKWTLEDIGKQEVKQTVLEDPLLINHIKLHDVTSSRHNISVLRPLVNHTLRWKRLSNKLSSFSMEEFIDFVKPCLQHLEELAVYTTSVTSSGAITPLNSSSLHTVYLSLNIFSDFLDSGILNTVTSLTLLFGFNYTDRSKSQKVLEEFPGMLSQLRCLRELVVWHLHRSIDDIIALPRVNSSSLRSLDIDGGSRCVVAFMKVFENCGINSITVQADVLQGIEGLFSNVSKVYVEVSFQSSIRT